MPFRASSECPFRRVNERLMCTFPVAGGRTPLRHIRLEPKAAPVAAYDRVMCNSRIKPRFAV